MEITAFDREFLSGVRIQLGQDDMHDCLSRVSLLGESRTCVCAICGAQVDSYEVVKRLAVALNAERQKPTARSEQGWRCAAYGLVFAAGVTALWVWGILHG